MDKWTRRQWRPLSLYHCQSPVTATRRDKITVRKLCIDAAFGIMLSLPATCQTDFEIQSHYPLSSSCAKLTQPIPISTPLPSNKAAQHVCHCSGKQQRWISTPPFLFFLRCKASKTERKSPSICPTEWPNAQGLVRVRRHIKAPDRFCPLFSIQGMKLTGF